VDHIESFGHHAHNHDAIVPSLETYSLQQQAYMLQAMPMPLPVIN
jgi:hypothetical protein